MKLFSELPKLLDRNFAVGYFLPTVLFLSVSLNLLITPGLFPEILLKLQADVLLGTTVIGLVSWLGGVLLMVANRDVIRLMEGYGYFNPAKFLHSIEIRRYRNLHQAISQLDDQYQSCIDEVKDFPDELRVKRDRLMREATERFPDDEHWVLPTSFGNTMRAFEVYPRVMYGLDAIPGWNRLRTVIPKDYRNLLDSAKSSVDFWVNLWFLSIIAILEYIGIVICTDQIKALWFPFSVLTVTIVAYTRARCSAAEWGDYVKSSFDIFIPELRNKLGFSKPTTSKEEKSLWSKFSQAIIYMDPDCLPKRDYMQNKEDT